MDLSIVLTIGKYLMLAALYVFVLMVFRGIIRQLAADSARTGVDEVIAGRGRANGRLAAASARPPVRPRPQPPASAPVRQEQPPVVPLVQAPLVEPVPEPEPEPAAPPAPLHQPVVDLLREKQPAAAPEPQPAAEPEPLPEPEPEPRPAAEAVQPAAPHLRVLESEDASRQPGQELPLSAAVTLGRSDENSLPLADRFVSSRHALICLRDGRRMLMDRGSTNGTFVNGERVEAEVELKSGDRIALGNTVFEYRAG